MAQGRSLSSLFVQALAERGGWPLSAIVGFPFAAHLFQWPEEELCHAPVETIDLGEGTPRTVDDVDGGLTMVVKKLREGARLASASSDSSSRTDVRQAALPEQVVGVTRAI